MLLVLFYRILNSQGKGFLDRTQYPEGSSEGECVSLKVGRGCPQAHRWGERNSDPCFLRKRQGAGSWYWRSCGSTESGVDGKRIPWGHGSSIQMCRGRWIITQIPPGPHSSVSVLTLVLPYIGQSAPQIATRTVRICVGATRNDLSLFLFLALQHEKMKTVITGKRVC